MKAILTTIAVIFFGTLTMAQSASTETKVDTVAYTVTLDIQIDTDSKKETKVARLYRFKNSRIKKALSFRTKRNRAKLA
ncbi:hypothetical protein [Flagellimonas meridianipacifica]|uniref:GLPGLI family protein n=1 Tax=Flagellimonas meridianipacifica TaxID=1080225 RepID=A0A2T0M9I2_9FLAO|nr:hypothetical protein [Allomuricauda pacifica]PRX54130.1 hypothetical protein CLV81_2526 [Allomuricauda pacifica]